MVKATLGGLRRQHPVAPIRNAARAARPVVAKNPTRFSGSLMVSPDRPARVMHQMVEAIVKHLTTKAGSEVTLKLEIEAEVLRGDVAPCS